MYYCLLKHFSIDNILKQLLRHLNCLVVQPNLLGY